MGDAEKLAAPLPVFDVDADIPLARDDTRDEAVRVREVEFQRARTLGLRDLRPPVVVHDEAPVLGVDVFVAGQHRADERSRNEAAVLVLLETKPVALFALVLPQERVIGTKQLGVSYALRLDHPEMGFVLTELRTSPRRQ